MRQTKSKGKGRTEITMFRCGEVKWTRERGETELRTQLSTDTRPPNLATLQPNLVKIFPCLMPSRERRRDGVKDGHEKKDGGKKQAKKEREGEYSR